MGAGVAFLTFFLGIFLVGVVILGVREIIKAQRKYAKDVEDRNDFLRKELGDKKFIEYLRLTDHI